MTRSTPARVALLEREGEFAVVDAALLDALAGNGVAISIEGPAGIGKTTLLKEIADRATGRGFVVHQAHGDELESSLAYGVVHQAFGPALRQLSSARRRSLAKGPAATAVAMLSEFPGRPTSGLSDPERGASLAYGLYWLVQELAEAQPRLLCLDDAHWADSDSLRALAFLGRRLEGLPVLVALAARSDPTAEVAEQLSSLRDLSRARRIELAPLAEDSVADLVQQVLGTGVDEALVRGLQVATGGNPFLVKEVLLAVRTRGWSGLESDPAQLARLAPDTIGSFVLRRLAAAGDAAQRLARTVAVLGDAQLHDAAELAGLPDLDAVAAADRLAGSNVFLPGSSLRFVHPILREAVRADIPPAHRALMHAGAARLLAERGASPEQVAAHLLEALPRNDPWASEILVEAASRARNRGSPEAARTLLTRALSEPPPASLRSAVAIELGTVEAVLGRSGTIATLEQAVEWAPGPSQRTWALVALARALFMVQETARALAIADELSRDPALDHDVLFRLEGEVLGSARLHPETRDEALGRLDELREQALPPRPATVGLLANLALSAVERNEGPNAVGELARLALTNGWLVKEHSNLAAYVINALTWADLLDEAVEAADEVLAWATGAGSLTMSTMAYTTRSRASLRRGDVVDAEADARIAHGMAQECGWHHVVPFTAAHLADALLYQGGADEALAVLTSVGKAQIALAVPDYLDSLGRAHLSNAQPERALEQFLACGRQLADRGGVDAPGIIPWRSHSAFALTALGRCDEARGLAQEEHEVAAASGVDGSVGVARTALALAQGGDAGIVGLEQAVEALEHSPRILARIEALLELGAMIRRLGRPSAARPHLRRALDLARRHGASGLVQRARTELVAAGARPRRNSLSGVEALTASERRVADLVASGLSNRQIAQQLYVSMRTVGTHLTHVYQKLGIRGREEIAAAIGR